MKKSLIAVTIVSIGVASMLLAKDPMIEDGFLPRCGDKMMQGHHHGDLKMHRGHNRLIRQVFTELDITSEQKMQIKSILKSQKEKRKEERANLKEQFTLPDASQFMSAEKFNKEAFKGVMKEQRDKAQELRKATEEERFAQEAETFEKIFAILTPKQRMKLIELSQQKSLKKGNNGTNIDGRG